MNQYNLQQKNNAFMSRREEEMMGLDRSNKEDLVVCPKPRRVGLLVTRPLRLHVRYTTTTTTKKKHLPFV